MKNRLFSVILSFAVLFLFLNSSTFAQDKNQTKPVQKEDKAEQTSVMHTYLLKFVHTPESCLATLDKISGDSPDLLTKIEWGCKSGDHTGYMIVNSKDEIAALQMVPASIRNETKAEKLDKFTTADIKAFHQKH
jgi:hypothetical protein